MRWQLPLVASLALVVAVGCDEQPLEPTESHPEQPTFAFEDRAQIHVSEVNWTSDVCGYDVVDFTGTIRFVQRTSPEIDEFKMYQWMDHEHFNLTGVGRSTGTIWRAISSYQWHYEVTFNDGDEAPEAATEVIHMKFIGQGSAPNFTGKVTYHYTKNANGDLVATSYLKVPDCS